MNIATKEKALLESEAKIKAQLVAPLTAVLCTPEELQVVETAGGLVKLKGFVNSQNNYGAMITTYFAIYGSCDELDFIVTNVTLENQTAQNLATSYI